MGAHIWFASAIITGGIGLFIVGAFILAGRADARDDFARNLEDASDERLSDLAGMGRDLGIFEAGKRLGHPQQNGTD
jgi:hypothetical protein